MPRPGFVSYAIVVRLLTMSVVWLSLLIWFLNAYRADCGTALAVLALLALVILVAGIEQSFLRRRAIFKECVIEQDRLFDFFYNRVVMVLYQTTLALFLGAMLLVGALTFEPRQWSLLFIDLLLLTLLIPRLAKGMGEQIRDEYRYAMARHWGMWFSVVLLWGEAIMVLTLSPPENYLGQRWQEVVTYGVTQPDVSLPASGRSGQCLRRRPGSGDVGGAERVPRIQRPDPSGDGLGRLRHPGELLVFSGGGL